MATHLPDKSKQTEIVVSETNPPMTQNAGFGNGTFFSFRYSYRSMTGMGDKTYVKATEKRYRNGKLESEEFEGVMDGNIFKHAMKFQDEMVRNLGTLMQHQIASFFKPLEFLSNLLTPGGRKTDKGDK